MLGFFDSGFGGLTILKEVVKILPQYSYIYLGDNARTPYGSRSQEVIYQFTTEGVVELFKRGAKLIILACNTSSASALIKIQQEFLPKYFPDKKPALNKVEGFWVLLFPQLKKLKNSPCLMKWEFWPPRQQLILLVIQKKSISFSLKLKFINKVAPCWYQLLRVAKLNGGDWI